MTAFLGPVAARDVRILGAIQDVPRMAGEIADVLREEVLAAWAEDHGLDIEWGAEDEPLGGRLLAISTAQQRGIAHVGLGYDVYQRLRSLERRGLVMRLAPPSGRGILWLATRPVKPEYLVAESEDGA